MRIALLDSLFVDPALLSRIKAEADFAMTEFSGKILALPKGARVLEIGCGTGFFLAQLSHLRPDIAFVGLEPIGGGFADFEETLDRITAAFDGITVHRAPIEDYSLDRTEKKFDFIFSLNVFEHLADWRQAVDRVADLLASDGQMDILCPNYLFPYEPHFRIPILISPRLTRWVFAKTIAQVERDTNSAGLWSSLNFITVPALRRHCRTRGLQIQFAQGMLAKMLKRFGTDAEFAKRQARIAGLVRIIRNLGGDWVSERLPPDLDPYMRATVSLKKQF